MLFFGLFFASWVVLFFGFSWDFWGFCVFFYVLGWFGCGSKPTSGTFSGSLTSLKGFKKARGYGVLTHSHLISKGGLLSKGGLVVFGLVFSVFFCWGFPQNLVLCFLRCFGF